jgi:pectate lyase
VQTFADGVLAYGLDHYGPKQTPLFVDGLRVETLKPAEWAFFDNNREYRWIYSDQLSHQTLFRVLEGLSLLTGDDQYVNAAITATRYAFDNLRGPSGLFYWGGHTAWDLVTDHWVGLRWRPGTKANPIHEMKFHLPYYDFMWRLDPEVTRHYLERVWAGHIINWTNLDMDRHAEIEVPPDRPLWVEPYPEPPVFFDGKGLTFRNMGTDLVYAGVFLHLRTGKPEPLTWAMRIARRFVQTRDPKTGLGGFQYSCRQPDRAMEQFGKQLPGHKVLEGTVLFATPIRMSSGMFLRLGAMLGEPGRPFINWALEDLTALATHAYDESTNRFPPMLTDGTDLSGMTFQQDGYYGWIGERFYGSEADLSCARVYLQAWAASGDDLFWRTARSMARWCGLGDIGASPKAAPALDMQTYAAEPAGIYVLLELHRLTGRGEYLQAAQVVGENILAGQFVRNLFVAHPRDTYAQLNANQPLALLHLAAALRGRSERIADDFDGRRAFLAARTRPTDDHYIHDFRRIYSQRRPE